MASLSILLMRKWLLFKVSVKSNQSFALKEKDVCLVFLPLGSSK
jgi:hypothetical protein